MMAVPAHRGAVKVKQPDGSFVTIRLHGDEWRHYLATVDGYSVVKNKQGYYVYARLDDGQLQATAQVAHDAADRSAAEQAFLNGVAKHQAPAMSSHVAWMKQTVEAREAEKRASRRAGRRAAQYDYKNFRGLVILVEFNDKKFSRDDYPELINDMINKPDYDGYTDTKGRKQKFTGSVRDYFSDNSAGEFEPEFDVRGPYTIGFSQYDANGVDNAAQLTVAAIDSADVDINYADYDRDKDGIVDMVFFVFAGNGANYAGDGSSFEGNDQRLLWPHRSVIYDPKTYSWLRRDKVRLGDYACSTELLGYTSLPNTVQIDGIGTICHEFSHVLGLPDFYDANYEEDGQSNDPGIWSLMAGGCYENDGRTPVGYSLFERSFVGFIDGEQLPLIDQAGEYTLDPLHTSLSGLCLQSPDENEMFFFENRQRGDFKWDAYLPGSGMLVHRADLSNQKVWANNTVNNNPEHNYYEVIRAGGPGHSGTAYDLFPGQGRVTELHNGTSPANLVTWSGMSSPWGLFNIQMVNGVVTFEVRDAVSLESLSLPETMTVGVGISKLLQAVPQPDYAKYTLTWASSNPAVATVDEDGLVKGVAEGTCTVTATSDNGCTASTTVTVEKLVSYDIASFKALEAGTEAIIGFQNAEVLMVSGSQAFVRDASGAVILDGVSGLGLHRDDVFTAFVTCQLGSSDKMPVATLVELSSTVEAEAGPGAQPRETTIDELTEADYCDYVLVKAVQLKSDGGVWATGETNRARMWNKFNLKGISVSKPYENLYFDVPAIYGTEVIKGELANELYLMDSPTKVDPPTGISQVMMDDVPADAPQYNLQGQRVDRSWKGIVIQGGRKRVNK